MVNQNHSTNYTTGSFSWHWIETLPFATLHLCMEVHDGRCRMEAVPEHGSVLQVAVSISSPWQGFPPFSACLRMMRRLLLNPPPQVALHDVQGPNRLHLQSTARGAGRNTLTIFNHHAAKVHAQL